MKDNLFLPATIQVDTHALLDEVLHPPIYNFAKELVEYLLIVSPPDCIKNDVENYKNLLASGYGSYIARYSIAHLTLASFLLHPKREKALIRSLQNAAAEESEKTFTTDGFAIFDSSSTLYLKIKEMSSFSQLSKNINEKTLGIYLPSCHKYLTYNPHLTIGKLLNNLEAAMSLFFHQEYVRHFKASGLLLLKRNSDGRYEPVQEFPFLSRAPAQLSINF